MLSLISNITGLTMHNFLNSTADDGIDLREFLLVLWFYKFLIAALIALCVIGAGYYALNAEKKFTSKAIFKLDKAGGNINLPGELGALISLAGSTSLNSSSSSLSKSQFNGRIFIEQVDARANLQGDPFFNSYNPNLTEPIWKTVIKQAIGWQKSYKNVKEIIWQGILKEYSRNVKLKTQKDGSIEILVTHNNAVRAAKLANIIMDKIILNQKQKYANRQDNQFAYLSKALAKALSDLEIAQSKLKAFALENSALPLENFAVGSLQLDALREKLSRTTELHMAVEGLLKMLKDNTTDQANYLSLRKTHPIIDQVEFRRVLGQNEIINSWSWPDFNTVTAVFDTLKQRMNRLQSQIDVSQEDAQRSSQALEVYGRLQREEKTAEATYTVLLEQVKAQSIMIGYRPSTSEIYEYATPTINQSAPRSLLIIALGGILGLFIGSILSLALASINNVFYTKKSLASAAQASLNVSIKPLTSLRNKSLLEIQAQIKKKPWPVLNDISVEVHKSGNALVVFTSSRARIASIKAALALAFSMQSNDTNIAIIDFSNKNKKQILNSNQTSIGPFIIDENKDQVSILRPTGVTIPMELTSKKDFLKNIHSLNKSFDLIFLCADNSDAISLLRVIEGEKIFHLTLARIKHTKINILLSMRSLLPFQGLIHD